MLHANRVKFLAAACNSAFSVQFETVLWSAGGCRPHPGPKNNQHGKDIMSLHTPDLTKYPPRSPRVRLGGYVILPRALDKGRATLAGKHGEYHYACPMDMQFFNFVGIDPKALKKQLGKSDGEVLKWIQKKAKHHRAPHEIAAWSAWQEQRTPDNPDSREYLNNLHKTGAPDRADLVSWFDVLDMDDFVSYGGKA
jgi:hypothetical protein